MRIPGRPSGPQPEDETTAWLVGEGDVLVNDDQVLTVHRDAVNQTVRICTRRQPRGVVFRADATVRIARRAR